MAEVTLYHMSLARIKSESHEHTVRNTLTQWLEESGATVYWGEGVERYDQETFQIESRGIDRWSDSVHRPDMLVSLDEHTTITEIKPGAKYGTIADGVWETFDYWNKHHTDKLILPSVRRNTPQIVLHSLPDTLRSGTYTQANTNFSTQTVICTE